MSKIKIFLIITVLLLFITSGQGFFKYFNKTHSQLKNILNTNEVVLNKHKSELQKKVLPLKANNSLTVKPATQDNYEEYQQPITTPKTKYYCARPTVDFYKTKKYYTLKTNLGEGYEKFLAELKTKLNKTFQRIEQELNITLNGTINLNISFQTSRADYEDIVRKYGKDPTGNIGKYIGYYQQSIVQFLSHEEGMRIAIHEAIHAFNHAYWGVTLRFLNEGMAEYYEGITSEGTIPEFDFQWIAQQSNPMQVNVLLYSDHDWHNDHHTKLYQNSKALFHFLMSQNKGRSALWQLLKEEKKEPCTTLENNTIIGIIQRNYLNFETDFDDWFRDGRGRYLNKNEY